MSKSFKIFLIIPLLVLAYYFLFTPYQVKGSPNPPFKVNQTVFSSKLVYYFKSPKVNDRIIFKPDNKNIDFIGKIVSIKKDSNVLIYLVDSSTGAQNWQISSDKIVGYIWYPF